MGHDRRCPPEGPDGVQVKCKLTQTRGELAHHHKQFRPRVQKQPTTTTATDPHFTTTHQASCNIPNGWEQTSASKDRLNASKGEKEKPTPAQHNAKFDQMFDKAGTEPKSSTPGSTAPARPGASTVPRPAAAGSSSTLPRTYRRF